MKIRMIKLGPEFLMKAIRGRTNSYAANLPDDAELLGIKYDLFSNQVFAIIRSDRFSDTAESGPIEEYNVTYSPEFDLAIATKSKEHQPKMNCKNKPQSLSGKEKEIMLIQNPDIADVEQEFTADQRKLLTFAVKGDNVIVKPIQFLKMEWDDINDIAKSLGGKWVKGDIISYWEIPIK
jgi:hypothetical protein